MSTHDTSPTAEADATTDADTAGALADRPEYRNLRRWNGAMAVLHFLQGALIVVLADVRWPITRVRYGFDPATETIAPVSVEWAEVELGLLVAGFLFVSAVAHTVVATVRYEAYVESVSRGINPYRWYEYAVSASLMIVVIAMLAGVWDLGTLAACFGLVAVMNLCGLLMEQRNQGRDDVDWTPYYVGTLAGIVPWITIGIAIAGSVTANANVPDFVVYIYLSIFVFFNLFAIVMVLQYREVWRWAEYRFGEKTYVALSLVAKSALAWQVYFGTQTSPI